MRTRLCSLDAVETIKHVRQFCFGNANARILYRKLGVITAPAERNADPTLERMLEGVGQQIEDDLLPHVSVNVQQLRERWAIHRQRQAAALNRRAKDACEFCCKRREIDRLVVG